MTFARWGPGMVIAVIGSATAWACGTPAVALVSFAVATIFTVLLPGMLVSRALRGRPRTLVADLSIGFGTGVALQLCAWAVFTASGAGHLLFLWPIAVVIAFLAIPCLRKNWTISPYPRKLHPLTSWGAVFAVTVAVIPMLSSYLVTPFPPTQWYPDMYWHLAASAELGRTVFPVVPQMSQLPFAYHWFAHAYFAAMSHTSGVDAIFVVARLWHFPITVCTVGALMSAADTIVKRSWPGVLASVLLFGAAEIQPSSWFTQPGLDAVTYLSPTHMFSLPFLVLCVEALSPALRGKPMFGGRWVFAVAMIVVLGGAKSSSLPVMVCGAGLALVVQLLRSAPWKGTAKVLTLSLVGLVVVTWPLSSAGSAGTTIQLFGVLGRSTMWMKQFGTVSLSTFRDPVVDRLWEPDRLAFAGLFVITYVVALAFVIPCCRRLKKDDGVPWLILGAVAAGFTAMILVNHDGLSQVYFMRGVAPLLYLWVAVGIAQTGQQACLNHRRGWVGAVAISAGAWGSFAVFAAQFLGGTPVNGSAHVNVLLSLGTLGFCGVITAFVVRRHLLDVAVRRVAYAASLLGAALGPCLANLVGVDGCTSDIRMIGLVLSGVITVTSIVIAWRLPNGIYVASTGARRRSLGTVGLVVACALAVTATAGFIVVQRVQTYRHALAALSLQRDRDSASGPTNEWRSGTTQLTREQVNAARLLSDISSPTDVVATNVHCSDGPTRQRCLSKAFWVSGLGQRRMLMEGWAYTEPAHMAHGVDGYPSSRQPNPDPELFRLNESAFVSPHQDALDSLYERGVRFLFADTSASPVDWASLDRLAIRRHGTPDHNPMIYELRSPVPPG